MAEQYDKVLDIVEKLTVKNEEPCKKTLQKIVYLIEEKGENLGFEYGIHFYGPYSAGLDYAIQNLSAEGQLRIEYQQYGHRLSTPWPPEEEPNSNSIIDQTINVFGKKKPSELELIATVLFVQRETYSTDASELIRGVQKIKGEKYSESDILIAIEDLHKNNYFTIN